MSGLAGLVAGRRAPGVYTWNASHDVADIRRAAQQAGAVLGYVDGWGHQTKDEFLHAIAAALDFPAWYGANLDALSDCLDDLGATPVVVLWDGWGVLARSDPETFAAILDIASDRAERVEVPFSLVLRGPGPDLDLPTLDG